MIGSGICDELAAKDAEVLDVVKVERRSRGSRNADAEEVCAFHSLEPECGPGVRGFRGDLDVAHFKVADVPQEEAAGWERAEHGRVRILGFVLGRIERCLLRRATSDLVEIDVTYLDVFNGVARNSAEDGRELGCSRAGDIA